MAITILDGGMGQELLRRGHRGSQGLWSAQAQRWIDLGASIIGGCCGIGPNYIRALSTHPATTAS